MNILWLSCTSNNTVEVLYNRFSFNVVSTKKQTNKQTDKQITVMTKDVKVGKRKQSVFVLNKPKMNSTISFQFLVQS